MPSQRGYGPSLNPQYTEDEVRFALTDSNARLAILASPCTHAPCEVWTLSTLSERLNSASLHNIQEAPPPPPESLAFLCYTSGTTGRPKGAMIRHQNIQHTLQALHNAWHWTESDTLLHVLPMFHIHGLFVAQFGALFAGATSIWLDRFEPKTVLDQLRKITNGVFMGVPHIISAYSRAWRGHDILPNMRLFTSGSAPPGRYPRQGSFRSGHRILERYGMTEVGIVLSNPYTGSRIAGTVGHPLPESSQSL